ncbi:MAG: PAS domain S-box protein, partial [Bacteroidota bacterium]|nr:PAS domain S-box protein [Bacteroidota bacterium]
LQDISARKKSEEKLERSMRLYAVISHIDQAIIHSHDKDKLLDEACRIFVDIGKFSMVWFGVIDRQTHQLKPYTVAGHDDGYLSAVEADITKDRLLVKGPVKTAIEELRYVVSNDIEIDPIMELYRDHSLSRGYRSFITLPLKLYHEIEGTLNLFSNQTGFFNQEEIDLLQEVAEDISYALEAIETEKERKLAAEKLSLSELKYRTIVNSTTEAILIFDLLTERCIEVNQAAVDMYGYTKDEFASMNIDSFSLFDDTYTRTLFFENIRLASDGSPITFEWEGKRRNNQMFWKESSLSKAIIDSKERLIAIDRDIDERKKIMQALSQSEERHRLMFEVADEGIYIAQDYKIDYFNPKMLKFSGYTEQELKEMGFLQLVHPDYRDVVLQNYQRRLMGERVEQNYEIKILRKDGTDCWVTVSGVRLVWNGKPAIFTLMNDISEQKKILEQLSQSEEMYRLITENASDVIWVWNFARNGYTFISPAIRQLRGLTVEEAMAESMQESLAPESRALVSRQLEKSIRKYAANSSDNDPIIMEIRQPCKDGRLSWIEVSARLRINKHHEFELVGVSRNIDERKRMEAEILNNQEKLREAVASKDKFFSIIAHDLKSPFNNVLDFCNLLVEKLENNDYEMAGKFAGIIQEATQRAMNLLVNLLEWSRSQTGRMEFKPEYIEMVALINEAIELNGNAAQQKAINITVNLPETAVVFADAAMINTVLRNLISNAVKFTRPGGEMIISAKKEKHEVQVSVQDNGVGIPKDHIDKLFRIDESMTTKGTQNEKGTGLGLILCKEFVDKHQGNIWVESEEGKGTTFYFTIPTS